MVGRNLCTHRGCGRYAFSRIERVRGSGGPVFACKHHSDGFVEKLAREGRQVRVEKSEDGFVCGAAPRGGEVAHVGRGRRAAQSA